MKKVLFSFILAWLALVSLSACSKHKDLPKTETQQNPYYPENEIITMENLYDDRMVIVIDTQFNVSTSNIEEVVEAEFPEVNVVLRLQNMADTSYYMEKALEHGQLGDVTFCAVGITKDEGLLEKYFVDLSAAPFISNYYQNALDHVAVNGKIYMLPGFSDLFGIVYDRTLFEARGWELPKSRSEFVALCQEIQKEEGYQAFMPTLKYSRMAMLLSHGFHYEQVIEGLENQRWLVACRKGEASFSGHMEPLFEGMKELFEAGVLTDENFMIEPGIRSTMLYKEHTCAMTMETQSAATYARNAGSDHEYGMMPFWNSDDPDSDYLVSSPGFNIYVNKRLEAPEHAEKYQKIMEILAYFSTPEGQVALMPEESAIISNVKEVDSTSGGAFMDGVAATIAKGNIFPEVRYTTLAFNNEFQVAFREALMGYVDGTLGLKAAMEHCDEVKQILKNEVKPEEQAYGQVTENFTVLETAEFVADVLRREAGADLALVLAKQLSYGETGSFYEGDITDTALNFVSLDYVSGKDPAYNQLVTVSLTGEQIRSILNYPYLNRLETNTHMMWTNYENTSYWVPSNLRIEYAPLLQEDSIISMKNMDGSEFDLDQTYQVAIWNGCFSNLHHTEYFDAATLAAMQQVTFVSEKSSVELIREAVMEAGELAPSKDGRITIRWDITPGEKVAPEETTIPKENIAPEETGDRTGESAVMEATTEAVTEAESVAETESMAETEPSVLLPNPIRMVESPADFEAIGLKLELPENEQWYRDPAYSVIDGKVAQIQFYDEIVGSDAMARAGKTELGDFYGIYYVFAKEKEQTWSAQLADGTLVDIRVQVTIDGSDIHGVLATWSHDGISYCLWEEDAWDSPDAVAKMAMGILRKSQ